VRGEQLTYEGEREGGGAMMIERALLGPGGVGRPPTKAEWAEAEIIGATEHQQCQQHRESRPRLERRLAQEQEEIC